MIEIDERVKKVVRALGTETMTRRGIMGTMDLRGRRSFLQYHLTPAMDQGFVRFVYPKSPNSPDQAYRLTEKGQALLAEMNAEGEQVGNKIAKQ